jgi:hypothetical protein
MYVSELCALVAPLYTPFPSVLRKKTIAKFPSSAVVIAVVDVDADRKWILKFRTLSC